MHLDKIIGNFFGGLMVCTLDFGLTGLGSSPNWDIVLGKTIFFQSDQHKKELCYFFDSVNNIKSHLDICGIEFLFHDLLEYRKGRFASFSKCHGLKQCKQK